MIIFGVTGTDGAGKGTLVKYLVETYGFVHHSSRELILEEITRQGLTPDRSTMRTVANEMRAKYGNAVIVTTALNKASINKQSRIIIESIRALAEVEALRAESGILLAVDADPRVRYERIRRRQSSSDQVTYDEFLAHEELEKNDPDPHGMQKGAVMAAADYTVFNTRSIKDLQRETDAVMAKLGITKQN